MSNLATDRPGGPAREITSPHLLVAHPSVELYGADRQMLQTVREFCAAGWRVSVVLPAGSGGTALAEQVRGVAGAQVIELATPVLRRALLRPRGLARLAITTPSVLWRQVRLLGRLAPDAVLVNTVTLPHWTLAARLARRPVAVHVHEAEQQGPRWARTMLYHPLRVAHRVIANSAATRAVITDAVPSLAARTTIVPNGLPDSGPRLRSAIVPGRLTIVSRLSPRKGITEAVEAVRLLLDRGHDVTLELCGSVFTGYEWFEEDLRRMVGADERLRERVDFAGFVTPAASAFARAEIVLAPSHGESFGNSVVEAMLAERPVVATRVQGLAEIVDDGRTGLLVPPGDPEALAAAVGTLLEDPDRADRLARSARHDALARFGSDAYGAALADVIADAVNAVGRPRIPRIPTRDQDSQVCCS